MKTVKRRIELVAIEHERILRHSVISFCPVCSSQTEFLTLDQAAALVQVETESVQQWLVNGDLHVATTPDGSPRFCRNSLLSFGTS